MVHLKIIIVRRDLFIALLSPFCFYFWMGNSFIEVYKADLCIPVSWIFTQHSQEEQINTLIILQLDLLTFYIVTGSFALSPFTSLTKWRTAYLFLSRCLLAFPCFQLCSVARSSLSVYWMQIGLFDSVFQFLLLHCFFLEQLEYYANVDDTCTGWHICHIPDVLKINIKYLSCLKGNRA